MTKIKKLLSILILMFSDVTSLFISFLIAFLLRSYVLLSFVTRFREQEPLSLTMQLKLGFIYGAIIILLVMIYSKHYTRRQSFWTETFQLLQSVTVAFIFILVIVFVSRQYIYFSRSTVVMAWLTALFVFPFFRLLTKKLLFYSGLWHKKVLIVGINNIARLVASGIESSNTLGYKIAGFLTEEENGKEKYFEGKKIIGSIKNIRKLCEKEEIKDIIIALPSYSQEELIKIIESCNEFAESIRIIPNLGSLFSLGVNVESFGDVMALNLNRNLIKPWNIFLKTIFEYLLIIPLLIILLPVFLLIALFIKLDSKGNIFFSQDRIGKKGKRFKIIKFRSMYMDGEQRLIEYFKKNPHCKKEWEQYQKLKDFDPRVTKAGRILRKFSLDEIPQLLNVLKGDMSLVGPRPYLPREIKILSQSYEFISSIKPGISGLWQVRGRNLLSFKQRILLDEFYIRNWSLWLDIVILLKTPRVLIKQQGAF